MASFHLASKSTTLTTSTFYDLFHKRCSVRVIHKHCNFSDPYWVNTIYLMVYFQTSIGKKFHNFLCFGTNQGDYMATCPAKY